VIKQIVVIILSTTYKILSKTLLEIKWYTSADGGNILGGSVHTIKKAEALVFGSKETGLEVNADKTKYMVMSGDRNAVRSQNIKIGNSSFERVEDLK
jgi:hypothetical protein